MPFFLPGVKVPGNKSSLERKFQGAKDPGNNVPSMELSLSGAKVHGNESSSYPLSLTLTHTRSLFQIRGGKLLQ